MQSSEIERPATDLSATTILGVLAGCSPQQAIDMGPGDLHVVATSVDSRQLLVVCFDYAKNQGSIGTREADQIIAAVRRARDKNEHLVLLLETSGIRVTDSTAGIASLRRLLREAEDARLDGVRMLAMILKSAFGGASMLSAMCEQRVIHAGCLFSMSGPKLIEQSVGSERFNASDKAAVRSLLGGAARAATSRQFVLVEPVPQAYYAALKAWLDGPVPDALTLDHLAQAGASLATRLTVPLSDPVPIQRDSPMLDREAQRILESILPQGCDLRCSEGVVIASSHTPSTTRVLALMVPHGAGARDALALARELIAPVQRGERHKRCMLLVDAQSHLATPDAERVVLSEALAHLAFVIRALHRHGQAVDVIVTGHGGGGIQGALGSGATMVSMGPQARLFVLPQAAMRALNKSEDADAGSIAAALAVGAIDHPYSPSAPLLGGSNHAL